MAGDRAEHGTSAVKPGMRRIVLALTVMAAIFAGWRIFGQMQAEHLAETDPVAALRWRPNDPVALSALAERQVQQGGLSSNGGEIARREIVQLVQRGAALGFMCAADFPGLREKQLPALFGFQIVKLDLERETAQ